MGRTKFADYDDDALRVNFLMPQEQLTACRVHGGRYWEVQMNLTSYDEMASIRHSSLSDSEKIDAEKVRKAIQKLPGTFEHLRTGLCAPQYCAGNDIEKVIFPLFLTVLL